MIEAILERCAGIDVGEKFVVVCHLQFLEDGVEALNQEIRRLVEDPTLGKAFPFAPEHSR